LDAVVQCGLLCIVDVTRTTLAPTSHATLSHVTRHLTAVTIVLSVLLARWRCAALISMEWFS